MKLSKNERQLKILQDINDKSGTSVVDLAKRYGVSQVTIRSDLKALQNEGLVQRVHGGAQSERIANRMLENYPVKLRIAEAAADLVTAGETIIIESGSTNALLARKLAESKDVCIVTNSYFIANSISRYPRVKIVMLGGDYQADSEVTVGPVVTQTLNNFFVDKMFIGSDGFSEEDGFTCVNLQRAEVAAEMARRANRAIVLTDSSKFHTRGIAKQLSLNEVNMVITDDGIPERTKAILERANIQVKIVKRP